MTTATLAEPRVERRIETLKVYRVVRGEIGDRVLTENGIEMIALKTKDSRKLFTVFRDGNIPVDLPKRIILAERDFSDKCHRYCRLEDPTQFRVVRSYAEGTSEYNAHDQALRKPWRTGY